MNISWMLYSFSGRLVRAWYWPLTIGITVGVVTILELFADTILESNGGVALSVIALLLYAYVMTALTAKRLHDRNNSALLLLLVLVPILGWGWLAGLLVIAALPGTKGDNRFGPVPRVTSIAHSPEGDSLGRRIFDVMKRGEVGDLGLKSWAIPAGFWFAVALIIYLIGTDSTSRWAAAVPAGIGIVWLLAFGVLLIRALSRELAKPGSGFPSVGSEQTPVLGEAEVTHRVEWISASELWHYLRSGFGEALSNLTTVFVIVGLIAGFAITRNWAAYRGVKVGAVGEYLDAFRKAIGDDQYWHSLTARLGANAATTAPVGETPATPQSATGSNPAASAVAVAAPRDPPAPAPPAPTEDEAGWNVGYITDPDSPISDRKVLVAQMTHRNTAAPGHIDVQATCAEGAVNLEFDSFTTADKSAPFDYSIGESDGNIFVVYRMDSGPQLLASNLLSGNHNYVNVVNVAFAQVGSDYKPVLLDAIQAQAEAAAKDSDTLGKTFLNAMTLSMSGIGALYGAMTPRDIVPFLRARLVRFQLPLQGGAKEVIAFSPQDADFRDFLAKCGIGQM